MAAEDKGAYRRTWEDRLRGLEEDSNSWALSGVSSGDTWLTQAVSVADHRWEGFKRETEGA